MTRSEEQSTPVAIYMEGTLPKSTEITLLRYAGILGLRVAQAPNIPETAVAAPEAETPSDTFTNLEDFRNYAHYAERPQGLATRTWKRLEDCRRHPHLRNEVNAILQFGTTYVDPVVPNRIERLGDLSLVSMEAFIDVVDRLIADKREHDSYVFNEYVGREFGHSSYNFLKDFVAYQRQQLDQEAGHPVVGLMTEGANSL